MVITTEIVIIVGIIACFVAMIVGFNVHAVIQQRRLRALLPTLRCPTCGETYGARVLSTMLRTHVLVYHAPPYDLYRVACPHCSREAHYKIDGHLDELPRLSDGHRTA